MCTTVSFNKFVRRELSTEILKRIKENGLTGSSWQFNQFNRIAVHVEKRRCQLLVRYLIYTVVCRR